MDREALLTNMAIRLREAAASSNWRELTAADQELAILLPKMNAEPTWTVSERAAFVALKRVHAEVREHCRREAELYATRMAAMREVKIAWMAYASQGRSGADTQ
jgi:hypothetical protein